MTSKAIEPLKVGLAGCGGVAQIIHLPILSQTPDVNLVALCDMELRKASVVANKFNVPHTFAAIGEMLDAVDLDVVFILAPNNLHLPMSLIALKKGVHIFIEKPAARNAFEARRIAEAAKEANRIVMVGMQNRFRADFLAIKSFLDAGELGDIFLGKVGWLQPIFHSIKQPWLFNKNISGGGVLLDLGIQLLDLFWWLTGKPKIASASAIRYQMREQIDVEDFMAAFIKFENNISLMSEFSWEIPIAKDRFYMELYGHDGTCTLNPLRVQKVWNGQLLNITPEIKESSQNLFKKAYEKEIMHFINFLRGRVSSLESGIDDAVNVLQMTDALYRSMEENQEISLRNGSIRP